MLKHQSTPPFELTLQMEPEQILSCFSGACCKSGHFCFLLLSLANFLNSGVFFIYLFFFGFFRRFMRMLVLKEMLFTLPLENLAKHSVQAALSLSSMLILKYLHTAYIDHPVCLPNWRYCHISIRWFQSFYNCRNTTCRPNSCLFIQVQLAFLLYYFLIHMKSVWLTTCNSLYV